MKDWREKMVRETKEQLYSMSLNSPKKIMTFFEDEFKSLITPVENEYPGTCLIKKTDESITLSIGKNRIVLENDLVDNSIRFSISRRSSPDIGLEQWGTIYFGEVTYMKMILPSLYKDKVEFVDKSLVDDLFYKAFSQTWLF